jgi:hypothetical protein
MMPGVYRVDPRAALRPVHRLGIACSELRRFEDLTGIEPISHLVRREHRQREQFLGGGLRPAPCSARGSARESVARLCGDHDARAARGDHIAERLQHRGRAAEIDHEERRPRGAKRAFEWSRDRSWPPTSSASAGWRARTRLAPLLTLRSELIDPTTG